MDRPGFGQDPSRGVDDMGADAVSIADMLGGGANLVGHCCKLTGGCHVIVRAPNHFVQLAGAEEFDAVVDAFMRNADQARPPTAPEAARQGPA